MSAKNNDLKGRWRCITIGFRVSPEEAYKIDMQVKTSGMTKQDFITKRLLNEDIIVRPNIRIHMYLEKYLIELLDELKRLETIKQDNNILDNITYLIMLIGKMVGR